jgi:hypothetical protein
MDSEEWSKYFNEIKETSNCYLGIKDEVLKLVCLLNKCVSTCKQNNEDMLSRSYVVGKATRILLGNPIILDSEALLMFAALKYHQKEAKK